MEILIVIIVAACVLGVVLFVLARKKTDSDKIETTPKGVTLSSKRGASAMFKAVVDESLTRVFRDARALGWANKLNHADYKIFVVDDCVPSPETGTLSFKVLAPNYEGSIYDVNPDPHVSEVFAAEQVILHNNIPTGEFIVCGGDLNLLKDTVRFGAEHILAFYNDPAFYEATKTHGETNGHPIIKSANEEV